MKYSINDTTLTAIGNAIREKTGSAGTYKPTEMATAIQSITTGGGSGDGEKKLAKLVDKTITEITLSDLVGITEIGSHAFNSCARLAKLEIPNTVTWIGSNSFNSTQALEELTFPASVTAISASALDYSYLRNLTILNDSAVVDGQRWQGDTGAIISKTSSLNWEHVYVSGKLYDAYKAHASWANFTSFLTPFDEYVGIPDITRCTILFGERRTISLPIANFTVVPDVGIALNGSTVTTENLSIGADSITFDIVASETEGDTHLTVTVPRPDGYVFTYEITATVVAAIAESSYEVITPEGVTYGFELKEDGYYESTNQKQPNSFAYCKVKINNPSGVTMYVDCINYAEGRYDYGFLSKVNSDLAKSPSGSVDVDYKVKFNDKDSQYVQTFPYDDAIGDCYITVKFIKDASGDKNNDSFKFKIRFE